MTVKTIPNEEQLDAIWKRIQDPTEKKMKRKFRREMRKLADSLDSEYTTVKGSYVFGSDFMLELMHDHVSISTEPPPIDQLKAQKKTPGKKRSKKKDDDRVLVRKENPMPMNRYQAIVVETVQKELGVNLIADDMATEDLTFYCFSLTSMHGHILDPIEAGQIVKTKLEHQLAAAVYSELAYIKVMKNNMLGIGPVPSTL